jgi:hypothetical protein
VVQNAQDSPHPCDLNHPVESPLSNRRKSNRRNPSAGAQDAALLGDWNRAGTLPQQ